MLFGLYRPITRLGLLLDELLAVTATSRAPPLNLSNVFILSFLYAPRPFHRPFSFKLGALRPWICNARKILHRAFDNCIFHCYIGILIFYRFGIFLFRVMQVSRKLVIRGLSCNLCLFTVYGFL